MRDIKKFFFGFRKGMENFGHNLSLIANSVLLSVVYLLGVGITSISARIFKKHFLDLKTSNKSRTYWNDLNLKKKDIDKYYRQF